MLLRHRLCMLLYVLAFPIAWFMAGPASSFRGRFDYDAFFVVGFVVPTAISILVLIIAWVFAPNSGQQTALRNRWRE